MHESAEPLQAHERALIEEEEALLGRVLAALRTARARGGHTQGREALEERLRTLRDEASSAVESDLPALFQQMDNLRALFERDQGARLPSTDAPYFAHLRLGGPEGSRDYLLGRVTFTDMAAGVRIIDWRLAPLSRVFYGYQEGDSYEEWFGERLAEGTVEARRLVVIERGVLTRVSAAGTVLERTAQGPWRRVGQGPGSMLAGGVGSAVRPGSLGVGEGTAGRAGRFDITSLLDAEQYQALSVEARKPLLVLGSAGSGKTTVALHRLARLYAQSPEGFGQARLRVLVPEEGLARLHRRLLEPLGLGRVPVQTLARWALETARAAFGVKHLKLYEDTPALVGRLKRHPALRPALEARWKRLPASALTLNALRRRLAEVFTDRPFLQGVVEASGGDLPRTAVEETVRHTLLQLATPLDQELEGVDEEARQALDGLSLEEGTPDALAGTLDVEDLPLLLFLKARHGALGVEPLAHAVLDEAEDFSLFELFVLGQQLGQERGFTLAGDEMQQTVSSFAGWPQALAALGITDAATCRLQVSYRCPRPIAELARRILGTQGPAEPAQAGREGVPVGLHHFPDEAQAYLFIRDALQDVLEREPRASVAVIASSPEAARGFFRVVEGLERTRLVPGGEFTFEPGVDVTDVESVKGLEWDYVVVPDATARAWPQGDEARRRLHVAVTRASHQLWLVSSGVRTRLLPSDIG